MDTFKKDAGFTHILLFVPILIIVGVLAFVTIQKLNLTSQSSPSNTDNNKVSGENRFNTGSKSLTEKMTSVRAGEFSFELPTNWSVQISTQTSSIFSARAFPEKGRDVTTYLDIQSGPESQISENPLLGKGSQKEVITENIKYLLKEGRESFLNSQRNYIQSEFKQKNGQKLLLTFYFVDSDENYKEQFKSLLGRIKSMDSSQSITPFIKTAHAQEELMSSSSAKTLLSISEIPIEKFKEISVMDGPYPERITKEDTPYKDGYARFYKFKALKGQRIETLAEESYNVGSFIKTELYNEEGKLVGSGDTRLDVPGAESSYTGTYYLIVHSFGGKEDSFLLKVFDLDQVQDLFYAKYADGREVLINKAVQAGQYITVPQDAVILVAFSNPVEILGDKVRYFRKLDNGCIKCGPLALVSFGDITIPINVRISEPGVNIDYAQAVPIKLTKIFLNQVLIQPADGYAFSKNKQIFIETTLPSAPETFSGVRYFFGTY